MTIIHTEHSHIQGSSAFETETTLKIPKPTATGIAQKAFFWSLCGFDYIFKKAAMASFQGENIK